MKKIISIIIPTYNLEEYLPKCLGSIIVDDQELLRKLDIIVVNDGSIDHSSEIAHEFEMKYSGIIRVIDKPNAHYGSCVNVALPLAEGTYVKILDADDYVLTPAFARLCRLAEQESQKGDSGADLLISNLNYVHEDGTIAKVKDYGFPKNMAIMCLTNIPT